MVIIPAAAAVIAATAAAERPTYPQKGEAPRERCLFRFRGIRATEGMRTAQPMQKRSRTVRANPPAAVRVPRSTGAGKCQVQPAIKIFKKICVTLLQNTRK